MRIPSNTFYRRGYLYKHSKRANSPQLSIDQCGTMTRCVPFIMAALQPMKRFFGSAGRNSNWYTKLFKGFGEIQGEYQIKLRHNAQPFALHVPRKVPLPLLGKTKVEIDRMLTMNVISRADEPTHWCTPTVVTPKASAEVRICVDLIKLNQSILREAHPLPSGDFTLGKLGGSKVFSKIDANSAFWQRKLSDDSCLLTTFITPWGRFCFNRLPYGISAGSEQFQKCMSDILEGMKVPSVKWTTTYSSMGVISAT